MNGVSSDAQCLTRSRICRRDSARPGRGASGSGKRFQGSVAGRVALATRAAGPGDQRAGEPDSVRQREGLGRNDVREAIEALSDHAPALCRIAQALLVEDKLPMLWNDLDPDVPADLALDPRPPQAR